MANASPNIPDSEFKSRFARAQQLLAREKLDVLLLNSNDSDFSNVRYFTDYWPIFEISGAVIPPTGEGALLIGPESETFARDRSKLPRIYKMVEYRESADPAYPGVPVATFKQVFDELGVKNPRRIGIAGYLVTTAPVLDSLRAAFPNAEIVRADSIMVEMRSVKSPAEIACLQKAYDICEIAVDEVIRAIKPGMTELQVVGVAQRVMYENGAEYEGHPSYVLSGRSSRHAISRPTHKVMQKGELVQLNIGARVSGYSSSVGLPVCLGKMTPRMRQVVEFGLEMHHWTRNQLKAGIIAADIAKRYKQIFSERGFADNYLYGPCHGIGLIEVEPPWMEEVSQYALAENMTMQVDTFLYDAEFGLRWENGARITKDGATEFSGKHRKVYEIE